jgi:hypothetical protein
METVGSFAHHVVVVVRTIAQTVLVEEYIVMAVKVIIPILSLSENNNLSVTLRVLFHQGLRLYFLTETKIYRQNVEIKVL